MLLVSTSTILILFAFLTFTQAQPIQDDGSALVNRDSTPSVSIKNLRRAPGLPSVSKIQVHGPPRDFRRISHSDGTKDLTSRDINQEQQGDSTKDFKALIQGYRGASRHQIDTTET